MDDKLFVYYVDTPYVMDSNSVVGFVNVGADWIGDLLGEPHQEAQRRDEQIPGSLVLNQKHHGSD